MKPEAREGLLGFPAIRRRVAEHPLADRIDAFLPQTQCGQCGYPGCRPYAEAIAAGEAEINQCPPGGDAGIRALADLLGREPIPLNPGNGVAKTEETVAWIDEARCIGCLKCVRACPVDAIVGAPKQMHTVIASECTGCELCLDPCPVDCIDMVSLGNDPALQPWAQSEPRSPLDAGLPRPVLWAQEQKRARMALARQRYEGHKERQERDAQARQARRERHQASAPGQADDRAAKKARIAAALAKVRAAKARQAAQRDRTDAGAGAGRRHQD